MTSRLAVLFVALTACSGDKATDTDTDDTDVGDTDTTPAGPLSFATHIEAPIVGIKCTPCHYPDGDSGGLTISYENIVGVTETASGLAYIEPGSPDDSYLWHKLQGTYPTVGGDGDPMPLVGDLTDDEEAAIEQWILDGALP